MSETSKEKPTVVLTDGGKVQGGVISEVTQIFTPATKDLNAMEMEISAFQCECGCSPNISVVQTVINRHNLDEESMEQVYITLSNFVEFKKAIDRAYNSIIAKQN